VLVIYQKKKYNGINHLQKEIHISLRRKNKKLNNKLKKNYKYYIKYMIGKEKLEQQFLVNQKNKKKMIIIISKNLKNLKNKKKIKWMRI